MKVKAISPGFHKGRRRAGDEFEVPDGSKASWFVPVIESAAKQQGPAAKQQGPAAKQQGADLV